MTILYEIIKNLKIILRDFTSVMVFVLGPVILIVLIGYIYGYEGVHDIKVGLYSEAESNIGTEFSKNLEDFISVISYSSLQRCKDDLKITKIHSCVEIRPKVDGDETIGAEVTIYADTSSPSVTAVAVPQIRLFVEASSYNLGIQSTETIFEVINRLVDNLKDRRDELKLFSSDLSSIEDTIYLADQGIFSVNSLLNTQKSELSDIQLRADDQTQELEKTILELQNGLSGIDKIYTEQNIQTMLDILEETPITDYKEITKRVLEESPELAELGENSKKILNEGTFLTDVKDLPGQLLEGGQLGALNEQLPITQIEEARKLVIGDGTREELFSSVRPIFATDLLQTLDDTLARTENAFTEADGDFFSAMSSIDEIKNLVDSRLRSNQELIDKVSRSRVLIASMEQELKENISALSGFDPELAKTLVRPIEQETSPLKSFRNIEILFPTLFLAVITFLSIIFSDVIIKSELDNVAYFRNIIAPLPNLHFLTGLFITNALLALFQTTIFFVVAQYQFKIDIFSYVFDLYVISFIVILIFTFVGGIIAHVVKGAQISVILCIFIAVELFFFSGAYYPLEFMPPFAADILQYNPVGAVTLIIKTLTLYGGSLESFQIEIGALVIFAILFGILAVVTSKRYNELLK